MGIGVLIISHDGVGSAVLDTAIRIYGKSPLQAKVLAVGEDADPEQLYAEGKLLAAGLDSGEGVLLISDLYGSTPGNLALRISADLAYSRCLSGLSLAMLVRVFNYPNLPLDVITEKAIEGGRDGIVA